MVSCSGIRFCMAWCPVMVVEYIHVSIRFGSGVVWRLESAEEMRYVHERAYGVEACEECDA